MTDAHGPVSGLRQACHDIRQPIAGVLALAGAALTEAELPDNARLCLHRIVELAEYQSEVVEHWLAGPPGAPAGDPPADPVWAVHKAVAAERLTWAGELTLRWPGEPVPVLVPGVTVRLAAANLLANATRAAGPSGTVTVEISRHAGWVMLVVEDSGPGFGGRPPRPGLGLSAVAGLAAAWGGRLECGRGRLGGGRVSLWLPAAPTSEEAPDAARAL
jgi:C4-dicarboxylate-specific signal transduction histidine kinase